MIQSNVVFLIDVNGVPRSGEAEAKATLGHDGNGEPDQSQNTSMELFPFGGAAETDEFPKAPSSQSLQWIRDFILLTLFKEANNGSDYDFGRVQWSYKFFDSSHHIDYRDGRSFMPFDDESFSNFDKLLSQRMGGNTKGEPSSKSDSQSQYEESQAKFLQDAIKIITGSLAWSEGPSLDRSRNLGGEEPVARNMVYALFKAPRTEQELSQFSDLPSHSSTKDFMGSLLPSAFSSKFHFKLKIQLNFVDMWTAPENAGAYSLEHEHGSSWNGEYPRQMVKCLQYLGSGRVLPVPDTSSLTNGPLTLGLIPYPTFLRLRLQQASQNENLPSHIQRLASKASAKHVQKVSPPEFDTDSVARSFKSSHVQSVLESSQNKILRPFGGGGGSSRYDAYEDDYHHDINYHRLKMAEIKAQDRLREGERKRKRIEYEIEDYHHHNSNRRRVEYIEDDLGGDRADVDSLCEREHEQRLESWINDSSQSGFTVKRKKHLDTATTSVPMSRSQLHRSSHSGRGHGHVFHEPAPKLPVPRTKKMIALVEKQKQRDHVQTSKRRSSEGLDLKRISFQQEKELSIIKRRLKIHLQGDVDDGEADHLAWLTRFGMQLREFADSVLEEDNPCLVALAQALVNSSSLQFTQQRLNGIRAACRKPLTSKDLLEEILVTDFTSLNKKIISAHEIPRDEKMSAPSSTNKLQKKLAFRETELQIILRLEIAWCFVEPDSDEEATHELLMEIVRLLQIIAAYRLQPPIDSFINKVLLPTYSQSSKFMKGLYKSMNIHLPVELAMDGSPVASSSRQDDDSSIISSTSSAQLYPEDSASQLNVYNSKHHHRPPPPPRRSPALKRGKGSHFPISGRKTNSGSKKVHRQILVASSNPKLPTSQYMFDRADNQKKMSGGGAQKNSPKRVRRNLFDVKKIDKKDSKLLMTLGSSSRLTKSPAFKSPKGKSPLSPSGFFRAARSRSRNQGLATQAITEGARSPAINSDVLCPESPATPNCDSRSIGSKYTVNSGGSGGRSRIVQESPEVLKNEFESRQFGRVASLSFYSTAAPKSRAWEKSENQLMAARIKDTIDLRSRNLTLSDLEILSRSPEPHSDPQTEPMPRSTSSPSPAGGSTGGLTFCDDSYVERHISPLPSSSQQSLLELTGPAPNLNNPNIEALITSEEFPLAASLNVPLTASQMDPGNSPLLRSGGGGAPAASPSNLQTPSKRVQFNLNENLVNTPASSRRSGTCTPKSILKETHD